jgi:glycosyltransferase involved in cell wall biosynthesis
MEPYPVEQRNGVECIRFFPKNLYWNFARGIKPREAGSVSRFEAARRALRTARWHLTDAWNRDAGRRLGDIMVHSKPDVFHTHLLDGLSPAVWREAARLNIPVIHTAHDYHMLCPRAFLLSRSYRICKRPTIACRAYRAWHMRSTRDIAVFASPSRFLRDMHTAAGLRSRRSVVVPNGIPLCGIARPSRPAPRNRFLLMTRLTIEKGLLVVLAAMASLRGADVSLAVAGGGPLEGELRDAAASDPRIRILGFVDGAAKADALAWADHLVLPSLWYENAPTVILEAAAHGLTVIGSRIGGIPEFVRDGETGLLFPPGDAAALAAAMLDAMRNTCLWNNLPLHSAELARAHSVPSMTNFYLDHYQSMLAERR